MLCLFVCNGCKNSAHFLSLFSYKTALCFCLFDNQYHHHSPLFLSPFIFSLYLSPFLSHTNTTWNKNVTNPKNPVLYYTYMIDWLHTNMVLSSFSLFFLAAIFCLLIKSCFSHLVATLLELIPNPSWLVDD